MSRVNMELGHDLFSYPQGAGWKRSDTSYQAAERIDAGTLRAKVLRELQSRRLTADECADRLGVSILSIRPRFSELRAMGKIRDTLERRPNASGRSAIIWSVAT